MSLYKSLNQRYSPMIGAWLATMLMAIAIRMVFGATFVSMTESLGWLMVASVVMSVFRGAPQTLAQMPYLTDHPGRAQRATHSSSS